MSDEQNCKNCYHKRLLTNTVRGTQVYAVCSRHATASHNCWEPEHCLQIEKEYELESEKQQSTGILPGLWRALQLWRRRDTAVQMHAP